MRKLGFFVAFLVLFCGVVSAIDVRLSSPIVDVSVEKGEDYSSEVSFVNLGASQEFSLDVNSKEDFLSVSPGSIFLESSESGSFKVVLDSSNLDYGVYAGEVLLRDSEGEISVPVGFEVESANPFFDVGLEVPQGNSKLFLGDELEAEVNVYNLRAFGNDVVLNFVIYDSSGEVILSESRDYNVDSSVKFLKNFPIDDRFEDGYYVLGVSATQGDSVGTSSFVFGVASEPVKSPGPAVDNLLFGIYFFVMLFLIVAFVLLNYYWNRRVKNTAKNWNQKLVDIRKVKFGHVAREIRKLRGKLLLLEQAKDKGYITGKSYYEGRAKINTLISKLKKRL